MEKQYKSHSEKILTGIEQKLLPEIKEIKDEITRELSREQPVTTNTTTNTPDPNSMKVKSVAQQFGGAVSGVPKSRLSTRALPQVPPKDQ
jgi:hypothetical protein